ncbi:MAG: hypothetical protein U0350_37970 [Caldilineaceae bacterium]
MTETTQNAPPPVKGSWEDLLSQAGRLAANQNDEAIPIYEKLISRLQAMTPAQRQMNNGRLQTILRSATIQFHTFQTTRDRYDEALALIPQIQALESEDKRAGWDYHAATLLYQAGRGEEALARLRARVELPDFPAINWGHLAMMHLRLHQADAAEKVLDEADVWVQNQQATGKTSSTDGQEEQALILDLRSNIALERGDWNVAATYYDQAGQLDPFYKEHLHMFYVRLAHHGQYAAALPYIERDRQHRVRADFWHGFVLKHLDQEAEARKFWQRVVDTDVSKTQERSLMEFVLSHYYLGDPEAVALGGVLRLLQEDRSASWELLFMAALGWALRGNPQDARANLGLAVTRRKALAEGKQLPHESWHFVQDLVDETIQSQLAEYFEMK